MDAWREAAAALLLPAFHLWGSPVSRAELAGSVLGLAMVACNLRVHPGGWPLAIASSLLYALVFAHGGLYGEAGLQGFFIVIAAWGWWQWLRGTGSDGAALRVGTMGTRARLLAAAATLAAWPALALALAHGTDSQVPWLDALPTVASVTGQVLLGRKRIESWPVWLAVNVFSVGLFAARGLWPTALLYAVFAGLSVLGWRAWRRQLGAAAGPQEPAPPGAAPSRG